jgi:hypothetical protein
MITELQVLRYLKWESQGKIVKGSANLSIINTSYDWLRENELHLSKHLCHEIGQDIIALGVLFLQEDGSFSGNSI